MSGSELPRSNLGWSLRGFQASNRSRARRASRQENLCRRDGTSAAHLDRSPKWAHCQNRRSNVPR